jgi:hypothetical protein
MKNKFWWPTFKWAARQTLGTKRGGDLIAVLEDSELFEMFWSFLEQLLAKKKKS